MKILIGFLISLWSIQLWAAPPVCHPDTPPTMSILAGKGVDDETVQVTLTTPPTEAGKKEKVTSLKITDDDGQANLMLLAYLSQILPNHDIDTLQDSVLRTLNKRKNALNQRAKTMPPDDDRQVLFREMISRIESITKKINDAAGLQRKHLYEIISTIVQPLDELDKDKKYAYCEVIDGTCSSQTHKSLAELFPTETFKIMMAPDSDGTYQLKYYAGETCGAHAPIDGTKAPPEKKKVEIRPKTEKTESFFKAISPFGGGKK